MSEALHQHHWRSGVRLNEILRAWFSLPKKHRTTEVLLFATDAAHLERKFVAERVNAPLVAAGLDPIDLDEAVPVDAGDE